MFDELETASNSLRTRRVKMLDDNAEVAVVTVNTMRPIMRSGQEVMILPANVTDCEEGDLIYCEVKGKPRITKVLLSHEGKGLTVGNMTDANTWWTQDVYGKIAKIFEFVEINKRFGTKLEERT